MELEDKMSFPVLLQQLQGQKSSSNLESGFRGSRIWPFDANAVRKSHSVQGHDDSSTQPGPSRGQKVSVGDTPQKLLHKANTETIAPQLSAVTKEAVANASRKQKYEMLGTQETLETLQQVSLW